MRLLEVPGSDSHPGGEAKGESQDPLPESIAWVVRVGRYWRGHIPGSWQLTLLIGPLEVSA